MTRREFWNRYLRAYDALRMFEHYLSYLDHIVEQLDLRPGDLLLDAGSGTGNLAVRLGRTGARAIGLDFSPVALRLHREKDPSAELLQASLEEALPFASNVFHRVACLSVLFAISKQGARRALREFRRVLRPGGRLVITAMKPGRSKLGAFCTHVRHRAASQPTGAFLREMLRTFLPLLRVLYYNYRMVGLSRRDGYRRLSAGELAAEVADAGFVVLRCSSTYGGLFHLVEASASREAAGSPAAPAVRSPTAAAPEEAVAAVV